MYVTIGAKSSVGPMMENDVSGRQVVSGPWLDAGGSSLLLSDSTGKWFNDSNQSREGVALYVACRFRWSYPFIQSCFYGPLRPLCCAHTRRVLIGLSICVAFSRDGCSQAGSRSDLVFVLRPSISIRLSFGLCATRCDVTGRHLSPQLKHAYTVYCIVCTWLSNAVHVTHLFGKYCLLIVRLGLVSFVSGSLIEETYS